MSALFFSGFPSFVGRISMMKKKHQIYHVTAKSKGSAAVLEILQASKLTENGEVQYLDLSVMRTRYYVDEVLDDPGVPLEVELDYGEYVMLVTRMRVSGKKLQSSVSVELVDESGSMLRGFGGEWEAGDGYRQQSYWGFPQLHHTLALYDETFSNRNWSVE